LAASSAPLAKVSPSRGVDLSAISSRAQLQTSRHLRIKFRSGSGACGDALQKSAHARTISM